MRFNRKDWAVTSPTFKGEVSIRLKDKVAIITSTGVGIGKACWITWRA